MRAWVAGLVFWVAFAAACARPTAGRPVLGAMDVVAGRWILLDASLEPVGGVDLVPGVDRAAVGPGGVLWTWGSRARGTSLLVAQARGGAVRRVSVGPTLLELVPSGQDEALVLRAGGELQRVGLRGPPSTVMRVPGACQLALGPGSMILATRGGELLHFTREREPVLLGRRRLGPVRALAARRGGRFVARLGPPGESLVELDGEEGLAVVRQVPLASGVGSLVGGDPVAFLAPGRSAAGWWAPGRLEERRLPARRAGIAGAPLGGDLAVAAPTAVFLLRPRQGRVRLLDSQGGFGRLTDLVALRETPRPER